ncbi:SLATT domain-containing protein [Serratia sp. Je.1.23.a]|uniref:SLATT domain-containing protein n=1 Tax=Serratia sp. Je.1.23.a TaxID=3142841 RepID=UPI0022A49DDE|nr:SLATT domain-containing protein [Serratia liquefaciens]
MSNTNLTAYKKLYESISYTADYRFNTYRRLLNLEGASNIALILASTALIVVSLTTALYNNNLGRNEIYINIGQNCLPIIMLALSILVSGAKYGTRAEKIHDCAQTLNSLKKLLKYDIDDEGFSPSRDNFVNYATQYSEIISRYENHSKIDLLVEKLKEIKCLTEFRILSEVIANLVGKGILYYFYLFISIMSVGWMIVGIYLAIKGATFC